MGNLSELILVVEDDPDAREAFRDVLEFEGYQTLLATNGQEALDVLNSATRCPDLLLSDLHFKPIDGLELVQRLAQHPQWQAIPVILLTGDTEIDIEPQGSIQAVLFKPVTHRKLLESTKRALA